MSDEDFEITLLLVFFVVFLMEKEWGEMNEGN
jgi:hypothetical protein